MNVEITDAERDFLLDVLRDRYGTLREQVHHTIVSQFHDQLKETEKLMEGLMQKLEAAGKS